jgi:hypothetical protein
MVCQSCGAQFTSGLSFCPRCGASLNVPGSSTAPGSPQMSPDSLIWAVVVATVVILGLILGGLIALKENGVSDDMAAAFMVLSILTLLGVDAMFFRLLVSLKSGARRAEGAPPAEEFAPRALGAAQGGLLSEPPASVTEHTTRSIDPLYRERKAE